MTDKVTLGDVVGETMDEDFKKFDLTEIQEVLASLAETEAIDIAHAELLQQQSLRGAQILSGYLSRMIKTTSYLESKVNSVKNKASLEFVPPQGVKATADMRIWAGNCSPEVDKLNDLLAQAKGSKSYLEKHYDILLKAHHHYKEIATGLRRSILGYNTGDKPKVAPGWE